MSDYPDIRKGTEWEQTSARQWQNLIADVERSARSDPGVAALFEIWKRRRRRVAIVEEVAPDAKSLTVRGIKYAAPLPIEGEYEWDGPTLEAYPDIGHRMSEFEPLWWPDGVPNLSTPVLDAHYTHGQWLVSFPTATAGGERLVVVRSFGLNDAEPPEPDPGSRFLIVQEVKPHQIDGIWDGTFEPIGDTLEVAAWPYMTAGWYKPFLWEPLALQERTTILPVVSIGGVWYLKQRGKEAVVQVRGQIKQMDCPRVT